MTRGTGIYDDDAGSAVAEHKKARTKAGDDESGEDTPDVDQSAQEPPD